MIVYWLLQLILIVFVFLLNITQASIGIQGAHLFVHIAEFLEIIDSVWNFAFNFVYFLIGDAMYPIIIFTIGLILYKYTIFPIVVIIRRVFIKGGDT